MPISGVHHVQVAAPPGCEREARSFYGSLLGLEEIPKPADMVSAGGAWFAAGGQELHVGVAEDFAPARKAHPALRVTGEGELERLAGALAEAGTDVRWDGRSPGVRRFFTDDPWGNRVELLAADG